MFFITLGKTFIFYYCMFFYLVKQYDYQYIAKVPALACKTGTFVRQNRHFKRVKLALLQHRSFWVVT